MKSSVTLVFLMTILKILNKSARIGKSHLFKKTFLKLS